MVWKALRTIFRRGSSPVSAGPASTLPVEPSPQEPLARFLFNRKHYAREKGRVKPRAFQPAAKDNKTSVFRTIDLAEEEVWRLADEHAAGDRGKAEARAVLLVRQVTDAGLRVEPDDIPPRHANLAGWPTAKDEWKSIAQELAAEATLIVRA